MNLKDLGKHFKPEDIEWRLQQCGEKNGKIWAMCLAYITNRAIMDRLDEVVGPEKWKNEYAAGPHGGVICGLSIKIGDEWVTKWDGAENTDIEAVKGGLSGAMKRAAVQWGIGRYLYLLEEGFAIISENGVYRGKTKENKHFKWNPPSLPSWALPDKPVHPPQGGTPKDEPPAPPSTKKNFKFLETMQKEKKRVGENSYYKILGRHGYTKSSEIPDDKALKVKIYNELKELVDE
jgi:hypothetical protein